jgi:hypothetical protein
MFSLTMLAFGILFFDGRRGCSRLHDGLSRRPSRRNSPFASSRSVLARLARRFTRMLVGDHHMGDHAMLRKKPVQPEAIPSGFYTAHDRRLHAYRTCKIMRASLMVDGPASTAAKCQGEAAGAPQRGRPSMKEFIRAGVDLAKNYFQNSCSGERRRRRDNARARRPDDA